MTQDVSYSTNDWRSVAMLNTLMDDFGRKVTFEYETLPMRSPLMPRLIKISHVGGSIKFDYNEQGMLSRITWPDDSYQEFEYAAQQSDKPWLLTSIRDENHVAVATYGYDSQGHAISTEAAGGVRRYAVNQWQAPPQASVNRSYDATNGVIWQESQWSDVGQVDVQTANGSASVIQTRLVNGMPRITSQSQEAGSGCAAAVKRQDFDGSGNTAWKEDFRGKRVCYSYDQSRNLEISRVEGLSADSPCAPYEAERSTLPANSRKVSTQWHPTWNKAIKVAEPRRLTTNVYNGQPDPSNGGATAWCAPSNAKLPDDSPIVVLCKQVEQATTDANGSQGFSATADASVPARVQQWTYNQYGQVITSKDPLNNTTTNEYYSDTTAEHTKGDLADVTNALNQVVARYTKYAPLGQWVAMVDANGVTTTRTFDLRQRLKSTTTAGLTTTYDYWPTGLLKSVALPDTSSVAYGYDDAHRLTSITDNLGNKITYTLDNSGNRIGENVTDPAGKLAKTLTRVPDALNRIQQVSGRE
jgi:YD repeat-containing protein